MKVFLITLLFLPLLSFAQGNGGVSLVNSGSSSYTIVTPNDATISENYAAKQLQSYLQKISGANLNIITESSASPGRKYIYIGLSSYVKNNVPKDKLERLYKDGIIIKTVNGNLIVSGGRPRGSLNAVYEFLEDYLSCRWWTPTESTIPNTSTINLNNIDLVYIPQFNYRDHFIYSTIQSPDFAATMKENGDHQTLRAEQGGNENIIDLYQTFGRIMPPEKYFAQHPEWYTDPKNHDLPCTSSSKQPAAQRCQLDLTNEAMYAEFLKNALELIKENPNDQIISISQNDNENYCKNDASMRIIQEEGSPAGPVMRFVNRMANDINKVYPNEKIETLAYMWSFPPPKTPPAKNVIIRVAPITANFAYALTDPQNSDIKNTIMQWVQISKENYFWGYNTNFHTFMMPQPSFSHVGADIKFLADNNFKGMFMQDNKYTNGVGYFVDLHAWVIGHLIWNPSLDQGKLVNEFMTNYYGPAAKYLVQYMDMMDEACKSNNKPLNTFNTDFSFVTLDVMNKATDLFNQALNSVKSNNVLYTRVLKEKTDLDFTWASLYNGLKQQSFTRHQRFGGPDDYGKFVDDLFDRLDKFNVKRLDDHTSNADYKKKFVPAAMSMVNNNDIVIQQDGFKLLKKGTITDIVSDDNASDQQAAIINGGFKQIAIQAILSDYTRFLNNNSWVATAYISADVNGSDNGFVNVGIYDSNQKKSLEVVKTPISRVSGNRYVQIKLPAVNLVGGEYVYVSVTDDSGALTRLKVDKIELTRN